MTEGEFRRFIVKVRPAFAEEFTSHTANGIPENALPELTLPNLIAEFRKWERTGKSCFTRMLAKMKMKPLLVSPLNVLPIPGG